VALGLTSSTVRVLSLWALCGVILLALPVGVLAQGKGHGVEVRAVSPKFVDADPGGIVSLSFRVASKTDREEEFIESLKLPVGWQLIIPEARFTLGPSEAEIRLAAVAVPRNTPAGKYEISYSVQSQRDYGIQDADTVTVSVLPVSELALLLEEKPDAAIAGEEYEAKMRLLNRGNAPLTVKLSAKSEERYPAALEPAHVSLPAGGSELIVLTVQTNEREIQLRQHTVQIVAEAQEDTNGKPRAGLAISVQIIPRVTRRPDLHHRVPAELVLTAVGDGDDVGFQAELAGAGTLDEAGTRAVDFLLRGPDVQHIGGFGERDEYRLNYSTRSLDVDLGDQSYSLSRLTDYYRYGRGLGITAHRQDLSAEFGAHYVQTRWERPQTRQTGAYVSNRFSDRFELKLNYLSRDRSALGSVAALDETLWSLECGLRPTQATNVYLEYGMCRSDRQGASRDSAYIAELVGELVGQVHYSLSRIHAGPDYYGYYNDSDYDLAAVSLPLGENLQARASYQRWKHNLVLRAAPGAAPEENLVQVGFNYRLPRDWYVSLEYNDLRRQDRFQPKAFDFSEQPIRIGVGRSSDRYNFRVEFYGGRHRDGLAGQSYAVQFYNLFASYRSSPRLSYTLYCQIGDDDCEGSYLLGGSSNVGALVKWQPTRSFFFSFYYLKYGFNSSTRRRSDQAELHLSYTLPSGAAWALRARRNTRPLGGRGENTYALSYTIPLGFVVAKRKTVGIIEGRVYDTADPDQPGIADAILTASGAVAVTDKGGRFVFPALEPGTYSVRVDKKSIGLDRVTQCKVPIVVDVAPGEVASVDVGVIAAAQIVGVVAVAPTGEGAGVKADGKGGAAVRPSGEAYSEATKGTSEFYVLGDPEMRGTLLPPGPLANVLVELSKGDDVVRRVTNGRGEFVFDGLRPGAWHLKVYQDSLPAFYGIKEPEMDLELQPSDSEEVTVRVTPHARRIRMIEEGESEADGPQSSPSTEATVSPPDVPGAKGEESG
jgi:hypothetical protein